MGGVGHVCGTPLRAVALRTKGAVLVLPGRALRSHNPRGGVPNYGLTINQSVLIMSIPWRNFFGPLLHENDTSEVAERLMVFDGAGLPAKSLR